MAPATCCAHCGSTYLRRARREAWQRVAFAFSPLRPYECWHCGWSAWLQVPEGASRASLADARPVWLSILPARFDAALWVVSGVFVLGAIALNL